MKLRNFENYEIDTYGNVFRDNRQIKPQLNKNGYLRVYLSKNGKVSKKYVHRLVAETYIPNPENLPQINHKDGNKLNNNANNLEWCTAKENINHSFAKGLSYVPKGEKNPLYGRYDINANRHKEIIQYDLYNNFIKKWNSIAEASRKLKISYNGIRNCCIKKTKKFGGYVWKYEKDTQN